MFSCTPSKAMRRAISVYIGYTMRYITGRHHLMPIYYIKILVGIIIMSHMGSMLH